MNYCVNGQVLPAEEATVSVRDRGFRYGDGAFETLRVYGGTVFRWEDHADRLAGSCAALGIDHGYSRADLTGHLQATITANDLEEGALRLTITRGEQAGRLTPGPTSDSTVVVTASRLPSGGSAGSPPWSDPARLARSSVCRPPESVLPSHAKTCNYLPGIRARLDHPDADEVLMLDTEGHLAEGTTSNLLFVSEGVLHTPTTEGPVLPGITRAAVLGLADSAGIPVETGRYEPARLETAEEIVLTNTTWEVRPVGTYEGRAYGPGPVYRTLREHFDQLVDRECY